MFWIPRKYMHFPLFQEVRCSPYFFFAILLMSSNSIMPWYMRSLDGNFLISSLSSVSPSFKFCLSLLQIIYLLKLSTRAVYESYISRCVCACSTERCMIDFVYIFKLSINIFELQLLLALKQLIMFDKSWSEIHNRSIPKIKYICSWGIC